MLLSNLRWYITLWHYVEVIKKDTKPRSASTKIVVMVHKMEKVVNTVTSIISNKHVISNREGVIDWSLFPSKWVTYHGVMFCKWLNVYATYLPDKDTGLFFWQLNKLLQVAHSSYHPNALNFFIATHYSKIDDGCHSHSWLRYRLEWAHCMIGNCLPHLTKQKLEQNLLAK